jgi:hypothetical protein
MFADGNFTCSSGFAVGKNLGGLNHAIKNWRRQRAVVVTSKIVIKY